MLHFSSPSPWQPPFVFLHLWVWLFKIPPVSGSKLNVRWRTHGQHNVCVNGVTCCSAAKSCPTLWPHGLQSARCLCPLLSPRVFSNSCPLSQWCYVTISSSVTPFSFCLQSFPASGSFPISQLFATSGQSIATVFSVKIQLISFRIDWLDLLAVQGTLKSLLQYHSSKASILRHPKNIQTIVQLGAFHMLARLCSKSFKLGFSRTWNGILFSHKRQSYHMQKCEWTLRT